MTSNETQFTHLSIFTEPGEHDNSPTLPLMDHLPEVSACGLHGTLGYDESLLLLVTLYISQGRCVQLPLTLAVQTLEYCMVIILTLTKTALM